MKRGLLSSQTGKLAQALIGSFFIGWLTDASRAEMMLMFMVLHLHLDNYYDYKVHVEMERQAHAEENEAGTPPAV